MYLLEYLVYHVKPFGLSYNPDFNAVMFGIQNKTAPSDLHTATTVKTIKITATRKSKAENRRKNNKEPSWDDYEW